MSQFGVQMHRSSKTKSTGSGKRRIKARDKRRSETGNYFSATKLSGSDMHKTMRRRGGNFSTVLKRAAFANVATKDGIKKVRIKAILESRDNRNFARQNIITKGAMLSTDIGKAQVTNSPGRDGTVNAKLLEGR